MPSPIYGIHITLLKPGLRDLYRGRRGKIVRAIGMDGLKETAFSRHNRADTSRNLQKNNHKICTNSQTQARQNPSIEERK